MSVKDSIDKAAIPRRLVANIGGNTAGATANISTGTLFLAGGNNVTLSQNANSITISGAAGGGAAGSNTLGMSNLGNTSGTTGVISGSALQYLFAGGNNITLSQSINASSATLTFSSPNMFNAGISNIGNTSGTSGTFSNQVVWAGGNNITLSQSTGANGATITVSAFNQSQESNTFGISNLGNTSGTSGVISGNQLRMLLAGGNNITLSQSINGSSATITISGPNAAVAPNISGFLNYDEVIGVSRLGTSNATFHIVPLLGGDNNLFPANATFSRFGMMLFGSNTATSASSGAYTHSYSFGFYTVNASSFSLVNSASTSFTAAAATGNTSLYHGSRWLTLANTHFATTNLTFQQNSNYYLAYWIRTSGQAHAVSWVGTILNTSGQISGFMYTSTATATWMGLGFQKGGMSSASFTTAMPSSARWDTGATVFNRANVNAQFIPCIRMDTITNQGDWLAGGG